MKFLRYLTFAFYILSLGANAQDDESEDEIEAEKAVLSSAIWLSGKWEGVGFADKYTINKYQLSNQVLNQNFELYIQCTRDSISILIKGNDHKHSPVVYLNESHSDFSHMQRGFAQTYRFLYLSPGRYEGDGRTKDRELLINVVNKNNISVSLTFYARTYEENLILSGTFKRVTK